ncbi:MAG: hypothetical protein ACYC9Q_12040 [Bacillota bacterium]
MASKTHQFILGLIIKNMRLYGSIPYFVEGKFLTGRAEVSRVAPRFLNHRPDVLGVAVGGQVCIGEAKTCTDLDSARTKQQIKDYCSIELNGLACEVFLGIPSACGGKLRAILGQIGLDGYTHLHVIEVPEEIING